MRCSRVHLLAGLLAGTTLVAHPGLAPAQRPAPDTISRDSVRIAHQGPLLFPVLVGVTAIAIAAPPAIFLIHGTEPPAADSTAPLLASSGLFMYAAAGPGDDDQDRSLWALAQGVELLHDGVYAEARVEQFGLHDRNVRIRTLRLGYLAHPQRHILTGITLGVRTPAPEGGLHGVEVGLPVVMGNSAIEMRYEPLYLLSARGVSLNGRFQAEMAIPHTALIGGVRITSHAFDRAGTESNAAITLLLGAHH